MVDVNLVDSVFSLMEGMLPEYAMDGRIRQPVGAAIETASPTNTYPCADGKLLCIAGNSDLIFARLMAAIGRPDLARDPAYATNAFRCAHREALDAAIAAWTRTLPAKEAEALLEAAECPARACSTSRIAPTTRISGARTVQEVVDPLIGRTLHPGPAIRLDGMRRRTWWLAGPAVGEHTDYVLRRVVGTVGTIPGRTDNDLHDRFPIMAAAHRNRLGLTNVGDDSTGICCRASPANSF